MALVLWSLRPVLGALLACNGTKGEGECVGQHGHGITFEVRPAKKGSPTVC